ncbi:MAG TPA: hypothetical protein VGP47_08820, partial [Parachlamydiaceae bacterium]|nr:hypothetical protein [Parachlamydiaceae bacterium]
CDLLELDETEKAFQLLLEQIREWLSKNEDSTSYEVFTRINGLLLSFRYKKNDLKTSGEIEYYINQLNRFMDGVRKELMLVSA